MASRILIFGFEIAVFALGGLLLWSGGRLLLTSALRAAALVNLGVSVAWRSV